MNVFLGIEGCDPGHAFIQHELGGGDRDTAQKISVASAIDELVLVGWSAKLVGLGRPGPADQCGQQSRADS